MRQRSFEDALGKMEHLDFGDTELEGEPSAEWYLHKLLGTGMSPVARHRAWVTDSNIPAGDRSTHEHHLIMRVIECACCRDQLNVLCLESFELLIRRAQVIESAHAYNPSSPDYSHSEDYMGWGVQRGGALVCPGLSKHAAARAAERSNLLRENRRFAEEMCLQKPKSKAKGKGMDKQAAADAEA